MQVTGIVAAFLLVITAVVVGAQLGGRFLINYRLSEEGLQLMIVRQIPVRLAALNRIVDVEDGPSGKWDYILAWRMGNRFFGPGVMVRTDRPFMTRILITPDDPEAFVRQFRAMKR